ncbi:hypothetical protein BDD12DRAFT_53985 [Trichophaea hybrida]|nr:hypothetical protein BDD12DRAFT_53985 [Trichophaea hybrida]
MCRCCAHWSTISTLVFSITISSGGGGGTCETCQSANSGDLNPREPGALTFGSGAIGCCLVRHSQLCQDFLRRRPRQFRCHPHHRRYHSQVLAFVGVCVSDRQAVH